MRQTRIKRISSGLFLFKQNYFQIRAVTVEKPVGFRPDSRKQLPV